MNTHESYVSPETAKLLKKAGFDWECRKCYDGEVMFDMEPDEIRKQCPQHSKQDIPAPTLAVAQRWLREEKNIAVDIKSDKRGMYDFVVHRVNMTDFTHPSVLCISACFFNTHEEALEEGMQKALEITLEKGEL